MMDAMMLSVASGLVLGMLALALGLLVVPLWRAGAYVGASLVGGLACLCTCILAWLVVVLPSTAHLPLAGGYLGGIVVVSLLAGKRGMHGQV